MKEPTFGKYGYPSEETLEAIRTWPSMDRPGLLEFVREAWDTDYGTAEYQPIESGFRYRFVTGGWSGNESLIDALEDNWFAWTTMWQLSARGGLFEFEDILT